MALSRIQIPMMCPSFEMMFLKYEKTTTNTVQRRAKEEQRRTEKNKEKEDKRRQKEKEVREIKKDKQLRLPK